MLSLIDAAAAELDSEGGAEASSVVMPSICTISIQQRSMISAQYLLFQEISSMAYPVGDILSVSQSLPRLALTRERTLFDERAIMRHSGLKTAGILTLRGLA